MWYSYWCFSRTSWRSRRAVRRNVERRRNTPMPVNIFATLHLFLLSVFYPFWSRSVGNGSWKIVSRLASLNTTKRNFGRILTPALSARIGNHQRHHVPGRKLNLRSNIFFSLYFIVRVLVLELTNMALFFFFFFIFYSISISTHENSSTHEHAHRNGDCSCRFAYHALSSSASPHFSDPNSAVLEVRWM